MTMGRNRTPSAILDAKGTYLIHPGRRHPNEPEPKSSLGPPPKYLADDEKKIWREIARRVLPGVACKSDRDAFELLVRLTAQMRASTLLLGTDKNILLSLWSRFGMTPADRSKVTVDKAPKSGLEKFLRKSPSKPESPVDIPAGRELPN